MKRYFALALFLIGGLMSAGITQAAETQAGDACTAGQTGWVRYSGGPEQNPPQQIRCNGTIWVSVSIGNGGTFAGLTDVSVSIPGRNMIANGAALAAGTAGRVTDTTAFGYQALSSTNYAANQNTALGAYSLSATTVGNGNSAVGYQALANNITGGGNAVIGIRAMFTNDSGYNNVVAGNTAMYSNTSGYNNVALGVGAMYLNTSGNSNAVNGAYALYSNTTGNNNTANGVGTMYSNTIGLNNTASGYSALSRNTTGGRNVAVGVNAAFGANNAVVTDTVALGFGAGNGLTSNTQSTLVGSYSGQSLTSGSSNTLIGYNAGGNLTTGAQNIIIGSNIGATAATTSNQINIGNVVYGDLVSQSIGVGKIPTVTLDVSGDIAYTGTIVDISDRRLKTAIKSWQGSALEKLALMKPITFEMKNRRGVTEYGFIAQEVQPIFPELVMTAKDASRTLSMNYVGMVAPMVKAIQELKAKNDALEATNARVVRQLEQLCAATKACH